MPRLTRVDCLSTGLGGAPFLGSTETPTGQPSARGTGKYRHTSWGKTTTRSSSCRTCGASLPIPPSPASCGGRRLGANRLPRPRRPRPAAASSVTARVASRVDLRPDRSKILAMASLGKVRDFHFFHGAALAMIAEHEQFTAVNSVVEGGHRVHAAYRVNDDAGLYVKHATRPRPDSCEYAFSFSQENLEEIRRLSLAASWVVIALVCVGSRTVCALTRQEFEELVDARRAAKGEEESQYKILVDAEKGKQLRAYVDAPGHRRLCLEPRHTVPRTRFPGILFDRSART